MTWSVGPVASVVPIQFRVRDGLGRVVFVVGEREVVSVSVRSGAVGGTRRDRGTGGDRRVAPAERRRWDLGGAVEELELRIVHCGRRVDQRGRRACD